MLGLTTAQPIRSMPLTKPSPSAIQHRTIWFRGDVQGVGFRAMTQRLASKLALAGTVQNLADGRVELIAEGSSAEIDQLIVGLREHFGADAFEIEQDASPTTGSFNGFHIRY